MLNSPVAALALKLLFAVLALIVASRFAGGVALWRAPEAQRGLGGLLAGALIGAKLGFWLHYPGVWLGETASPWFAVSGLSVPGACAGGALGLALAARARAPALADLLMPPALVLLLVLDLGAVTWSLTEPGFGAAAQRWGINFGDGIPRHPVMLYDAMALVALWWAAQRAGTQLVEGAWPMGATGATADGQGTAGGQRTPAGPSAGASLAPGLAAAMVGAGCFGVWFLLGFLKPPFGPILMLEAIYPRPALYWPGLTGEQWLCLGALLPLGVFCARRMGKSAQGE